MEINDILTQLPDPLGNGTFASKLSEKEIQELLEFSLENDIWEELFKRAYNPLVHTIDYFINFSEKMEVFYSQKIY